MTVESGAETTETKTSRMITWKPFFESLKEKGLLPDPDRTTRIVIEAKVGEVVTITYYTLGDERLVEALEGAQETDDPVDAVVR